MRKIIVDCSVILALVLHDESSRYADLVAEEFTQYGFHVPSHFTLETGNALLMAKRRGRLTEETLLEAFYGISALDPQVDPLTSDCAHHDTLKLALKHNLTLYDAAYLELAMRLEGVLATLDKGLQRAAESEGVLMSQPDTTT